MKMDFDEKINEIPYEEYGDLLSERKLTVYQIKYGDGYVMVSGYDGSMWKVTAKNVSGKFIAILERVD